MREGHSSSPKVHAFRSRHTMHLLGPRPSRNPDLSVQPTYYLFIRTVPGWSATWRNRLREFAELAFLARVPSELCLHSFRFGSLLFSTSSFELVRSSIFFRPSHLHRSSLLLTDLPSTFFQLTHTRARSLTVFSRIPTHPPLFFFSLPYPIPVMHPATIPFPPLGRTPSQDPVDVNVRLIM